MWKISQFYSVVEDKSKAAISKKYGAFRQVDCLRTSCAAGRNPCLTPSSSRPPARERTTTGAGCGCWSPIVSSGLAVGYLGGMEIGSSHRKARDGHRLGSQRLSVVLVLEESRSSRSPAGLDGRAGAGSTNEYRQPRLLYAVRCREWLKASNLEKAGAWSPLHSLDSDNGSGEIGFACLGICRSWVVHKAKRRCTGRFDKTGWERRDQ